MDLILTVRSAIVCSYLQLAMAFFYIAVQQHVNETN